SCASQLRLPDARSPPRLFSRPVLSPSLHSFAFFFTHTATTEIYTLSLHDALPISASVSELNRWPSASSSRRSSAWFSTIPLRTRSEEHTSELQSRRDLVCRLLLEKKNKSRYLFSGQHRTPAFRHVKQHTRGCHQPR